LYSELVESAYRIEIVLGATQSGHYTGFYTARLKELVFKKHNLLKYSTYN